MTTINPISNVRPTTSYGEFANSTEIHNAVKALVKELLEKNPNISDADIRTQVENYIKSIKNEGTEIGNAQTVELNKLTVTIKDMKDKIAELAEQKKKNSSKIPLDEIPSEVIRANSVAISNTKQENVVNKAKRVIGSDEKKMIEEICGEMSKQNEKIKEKEVVKEVTKEVSKNNKWAIVGAFMAGSLLTILGEKIINNKNQAKN